MSKYKNYDELKFSEWYGLDDSILFDIKYQMMLYTDNKTKKKRIIHFNDLPHLEVETTYDSLVVYKFGFLQDREFSKKFIFYSIPSQYALTDFNTLTDGSIMNVRYIKYINGGVTYSYDLSSEYHLPDIEDFVEERDKDIMKVKLHFYKADKGYEEDEVGSGNFILKDNSDKDIYKWEELKFNENHIENLTRIERYMSWAGHIVGIR